MDKIEQAQSILQDYWGSSGPDATLRRADLRRLYLKRSDIIELFDNLPPPGVEGTTGQRISECYRFLENL